MSRNQILSDFGLFAQHRFWNEVECRQLCEISRTSRVEEAGIYSEGKLQVDERFRKTERILLDSSLSEQIHQSIFRAKPNLESHFRVRLSGLQPFQILHYRPGDYFRTHQDERRPVSDSTRKVSLVLFLNSKNPGTNGGFGGGDIAFYRDFERSLAGDGFHFPAEEGLLLAFSSYLLHEVMEVTSGDRFSIVSWFF